MIYAELITRAILAELEEIDEVNGYSTTVARVERYDPRASRMAERPGVRLQYVRRNREWIDGPGGWRVQMELQLWGYLPALGAESPMTLDELYLAFGEDMVKALKAAMDPFADEPLNAQVKSISDTPFSEETDNDVNDGVLVRTTIEWGERYNEPTTGLTQ